MVKIIARESLVYGLVKILSVLFGFITLPFYTRVYSISDYGLVSLYSTFLPFGTLIFGLAIENAVTRYYFDPKHDRNLILRTCYKFYILYGFTLCAIYSIIFFVAVGLNRYDEALYTVSVLVVGVFLSNLFNLYLTVCRLESDLSVYAKASLLTSVVGVLVSMICVYVFGTVLAYFLGLVAANLIGCCFLADKIKVTPLQFLHTKTRAIKPYLLFSLPLIPASLATYINSSADRWALSVYLSDSDVAVYAIGAKVASAAHLGVSTVMLALLPISMKIIQQNEPLASHNLDRLARYYTLVCVIGLVSLQSSSPFLVSILAPEIYISASLITGILALSTVFFGYTYFSTLGSWKAGKSSDYSVCVAIGVLANIALNLLLVREYGIVGVSAATALGMLITVILSFFLSALRHSFNFSFLRVACSLGLVSIWIYSTISGYTETPESTLPSLFWGTICILSVGLLCLTEEDLASARSKVHKCLGNPPFG
jgi:O-antigen/teichoic acid export membrane protein